LVCLDPEDGCSELLLVNYLPTDMPHVSEDMNCLIAYICSVQKETEEIPLKSQLINEKFNRDEHIPWVNR
jgi:hypothetical protein